MGLSFVVLFLSAFLVISALCEDLPMLNIDGFAWAENLAFDGLGGLFVSESVLGSLFRISYNEAASNYSIQTHISRGFKQFGGLAPTPDGKELYAGVVFEDGAFGIIKTSTRPSLVGDQSYSIISRDMDHLNNGMALVPSENAIYGTSEKGTLTRVDVATGEKTVISDTLAKPDGLWYDESSGLLFIGELVTKRMMVYNPKSKEFSDYYVAASGLSAVHLMDDLTLIDKVDSTDLGSTMLVAADWTGRQIVKFSLDGKRIETIPAPEGIKFYEPTSIRRGKGPGFDTNSFYITEGGGATRHEKGRRVLQMTPGSI